MALLVIYFSIQGFFLWLDTGRKNIQDNIRAENLWVAAGLKQLCQIKQFYTHLLKEGSNLSYWPRWESTLPINTLEELLAAVKLGFNEAVVFDYIHLKITIMDRCQTLAFT